MQTETTVQKDIHLLESMQRGFGSRGSRPGPLVIDPCGGVHSKHPVMHLQRWMRDANDGEAFAAQPISARCSITLHLVAH